MSPAIYSVSGVLVVAESRSAREFDDVLQITVKFTLEANNRTGENTSYIPKHSNENAF